MGNEEGLVIKMGLLGVILLTIVTILPLSHQQGDIEITCWHKIENCLENSTQNLTGAFIDGTISQAEYLCCPFINNEWKTEKQCFCSLDSNGRLTSGEYLSNCGFPTFDVLCPLDNSSNSPDSSTFSPGSPLGSGSEPSPNAASSNTSSKSPHSSNFSPGSPVGSGSETSPKAASSRKINIALALGVPFAILVIFGLVIGGICAFCRQHARQRPYATNYQNGNIGTGNGLQRPYVTNYQNGNVATENIHVLPKPQVANYQSSVASESYSTPYVAQYPPQAPSVVFPSVPTRDDIVTSEALQFELQILEAATNNFSEDCKIGRGGFGFVYKGTLANGQDIAVKRLSGNSGQGDKEFRTEVELLAKLRHRNLVSLLGFCLAGAEKLLVYEFVANKSLDYFLFDLQKKQQLTWSIRYEIIRGTARGMLYLHEDSPTRIIHRDLKAANVLLDANMNSKIADFGLARMFDLEQTHISTSRVAGTHGYMAPEYLMLGQMSVKSDVYSFGVLALEIVSGKRINAPMGQSGAGDNLLSNAWKCWEEGRPLDFMDPTIKDCYSENEVIKCIHFGLLSVQEDVNKRPTMARILYMLDSNSSNGRPSMPNRPMFQAGGFSDQSTTRGSDSSSLLWSGPA